MNKKWRLYREKIYFLEKKYWHRRADFLHALNSQIASDTGTRREVSERTYKKWIEDRDITPQRSKMYRFDSMAKIFGLAGPDELKLMEGEEVNPVYLDFYKKSDRQLAIDINLNGVKAIIFDFDGTLFTGAQHSWEVIFQELDCVKKRQVAYQKYAHEHANYQQFCDDCVSIFSNMGLTKVKIAQLAKKHCELIPNAIEGLKYLAKQNIKLILFSGGIDSFLETLIPDYNSLFDEVFINKFNFDTNGVISSCTANMWAARKSKIIEHIKDKYQYDASNIFYFGDNHCDIYLKETGAKLVCFKGSESAIRIEADIFVDEIDFLKIINYVFDKNRI